MTTATIEDTEITQLWGDRKAFEQRCMEYGQRTGADVRFVIKMPFKACEGVRSTDIACD